MYKILKFPLNFRCVCTTTLQYIQVTKSCNGTAYHSRVEVQMRWQRWSQTVNMTYTWNWWCRDHLLPHATLLCRGELTKVPSEHIGLTQLPIRITIISKFVASKARACSKSLNTFSGKRILKYRFVLVNRLKMINRE